MVEFRDDSVPGRRRLATPIGKGGWSRTLGGGEGGGGRWIGAGVGWCGVSGGKGGVAARMHSQRHGCGNSATERKSARGVGATHTQLQFVGVGSNWQGGGSWRRGRRRANNWMSNWRARGGCVHRVHVTTNCHSPRASAAHSLAMAPSRPPRAPPRAPRDPKELLKKRGADLIRKISDKDRYGIFLQPVDVDAIDGYAQLIARPMDLSTCQNNLAMGVYRTPMELRTDLDLIWSNCCTFNADDSIYFKEAVRLRAVCARYYDDFVKALVKDGVAPALGLYRASGASSSARLPPRRPPRPRVPDHTARLASPSVQHSDLNSVDADVDTHSASASASVAHAASFRDVHLRRARANYDAAVTAAAAAIHEARQAAQAAGLPDAPPPAEGQIFKGPNNEFQDNAPAHAAASSAIHTQLFRSQRLRESCSQIPLAWRRIGRWHSRGATQSAFLTTERARDVRYGLKYEQFVRDSAPMARRLLASILDPQVVRQHDLAQMEKLSKQTTGSSSRVEHTLKKSGNLTPNGVHSDGKKNGVTDAMDVDKPAKASYDKLPKSKKRPRSSTELATANGVHMNATSSAFGEQLKDLIEPKRFKHVSPKRVDELSQASLHVPPKQSIYRVRSLLRSKGIDPKFVSAIMTDDAESYCADAQNNVVQDGVAASQQRKMEQLLNSNYAIMMNVLRLRALRESAAETMQESIEDKERDSVEMLANGLSLAVRSVPPRFVVHPADAAESALCMAQSINERQERVERQAKSSKGKT